MFDIIFFLLESLCDRFSGIREFSALLRCCGRSRALQMPRQKAISCRRLQLQKRNFRLDSSSTLHGFHLSLCSIRMGLAAKKTRSTKSLRKQQFFRICSDSTAYELGFSIYQLFERNEKIKVKINQRKFHFQTDASTQTASLQPKSRASC
jgi:hypothetical protein